MLLGRSLKSDGSFMDIGIRSYSQSEFNMDSGQCKKLKNKDISELRIVCGAYSMAHALSEYLDEIHNDLPEMIECYDFRNYLKDFIEQLSHYWYEKEDILSSLSDDVE